MFVAHDMWIAKWWMFTQMCSTQGQAQNNVNKWCTSYFVSDVNCQTPYYNWLLIAVEMTQVASSSKSKFLFPFD